MYLDLLARPLPARAGRHGGRADDAGGSGRIRTSCRSNGDEVRVTADTVVLGRRRCGERPVPPAPRERSGAERDDRAIVHGAPPRPGRWTIWSARRGGAARQSSGHGLDVFALHEATQRDEHLLNVSVQVRPRGGGTPGPTAFECDLYARAEQAPIPRAGWSSAARSIASASASRSSIGACSIRTGPASCAPRSWWPQPSRNATAPRPTCCSAPMILGLRPGGTGRGPELELGQPPHGHHPHGRRAGRQRRRRPGLPTPRDGQPLRGGQLVFPTGGYANPTFTIVALAHRLVAHLSARA